MAPVMSEFSTVNDLLQCVWLIDAITELPPPIHFKVYHVYGLTDGIILIGIHGCENSLKNTLLLSKLVHFVKQNKLIAHLQRAE
jgi:hypothetical protein